MARRSRKKSDNDPFRCPRCGTRVDEPVKTWTLVSPIPDKKGRITITIMGLFKCPKCGYTWRAVLKKIKSEVGEAEEEGEREPGEVIEIDLSELKNLD
jgi:predicted RNA-binding Zn-ribbon protein involved in translation (DUF1610 family)